MSPAAAKRQYSKQKKPGQPRKPCPETHSKSGSPAPGRSPAPAQRHRHFKSPVLKHTPEHVPCQSMKNQTGRIQCHKGSAPRGMHPGFASPVPHRSPTLINDKHRPAPSIFHIRLILFRSRRRILRKAEDFYIRERILPYRSVAVKLYLDGA